MLKLLFIGDEVLFSQGNFILSGVVREIKKCQPNGTCITGINGYPMSMGTPKIRVIVEAIGEGLVKGTIEISIMDIER